LVLLLYEVLIIKVCNESPVKNSQPIDFESEGGGLQKSLLPEKALCEAGSLQNDFVIPWL